MRSETTIILGGLRKCNNSTQYHAIPLLTVNTRIKDDDTGNGFSQRLCVGKACFYPSTSVKLRFSAWPVKREIQKSYQAKRIIWVFQKVRFVNYP